MPVFTIRNTDIRFAWLTNYLETWLSSQLWKQMTIATIAYEYRALVNEFALLTTGSTAGTEFQVHDFSYRGLSGTEDAAASGAAFLLSTCGTDNIPGLYYATKFYGANMKTGLIGTSVPASEHSLASTGIAVDGELETYRKWITKDYPTGIVSVISDTLDFFRVVTEFATELKYDILNRQPNALGLAKVVFRPDSGCPVKILTGYLPQEIRWAADFSNAVRTDIAYCIETGRKLSEPEIKGAVQCLWDIFGGTTTEQGYKQLHERVGLIYGDSITLERAEQILKRLAKKGFASTNVVFGVGSYTCQYLTRDSMGIAVKATAAVVDGQTYALSKDPTTDDGTKKSAKGLLRVE
ncbi:MAG: nicotinate phosphoribosyltransferase, partial [Polynucleobacter sp. 32-46-5]